MQIRAYTPADELEWLRCRVLSFLDSSYSNDVVTQKETYENESISLVAEESSRIIGLIDIELEKSSGDLCVAGAQRGAVIWHLAVLTEYRRMHVATQLWEAGKALLIGHGIQYCEVWTQEDLAANRWYQANGFRNIREQNWLRCYARPSKADWFLQRENVGEIFGVEEMIFKVKPERRAEIAEYCYRIDEVRLYATQL